MPVINPVLFYLIGVCGNVLTISVIGLITFGLAAFMLGIYLIFMDKDYDGEYKYNKKLFKISLIFAIIFAILSSFVPSSKTVTKMIIAKNVTYERLEKIPEVTNDIRGAIKKDVIDIINAINKKETGDDDKVTM